MHSNTQNKKNLTLTEIMPPEKANFGGNIFGGYLMELLDRAAYACAARYSGCYVVTLSADQILFREPIHVGELVSFLASVNHVGRSSMEIGIKVTAENLTSGVIRHTNTCYFTMVALDENHRPTPVPALSLNTTDEKRRFEEACFRKQQRQKFDQLHQDHKATLKKRYSRN